MFFGDDQGDVGVTRLVEHGDISGDFYWWSVVGSRCVSGYRGGLDDVDDIACGYCAIEVGDFQTDDYFSGRDGWDGFIGLSALAVVVLFEAGGVE